MKEAKLIARQAMQIAELEEAVKYYKKSFDNISSILYCTGGPLNANFHQYNKKQLGAFFDIDLAMKGE